MKADLAPGAELKIYGRNACLAMSQLRAQDIIRVYVTEDRLSEFSGLLRWCARQKKAYHVVTADDLAKIAHSVHHEGVLFLAKDRPALSDVQLLALVAEKLAKKAGPLCLIYLDGVQNPHNIGSIARVAAHFGVPVLMGMASELPKPNGAMMRTAEGGLEHLQFAALGQAKETFGVLRKQGFKLIGSSSHSPHSLYDTQMPARSIVILGGEVSGANPALLAFADHVVRIPGTGIVESLNVANAAGLLLGEHWRLHHGA